MVLIGWCVSYIIQELNPTSCNPHMGRWTLMDQIQDANNLFHMAEPAYLGRHSSSVFKCNIPSLMCLHNLQRMLPLLIYMLMVSLTNPTMTLLWQSHILQEKRPSALLPQSLLNLQANDTTSMLIQITSSLLGSMRACNYKIIKYKF